MTPTCHPERKHMAKGLCGPCYSKKYDSDHRQTTNKTKRAWRLRNKAKVSAIRRKYHYGISEEEFQIRLAAQNGLCAICRSEPGTDVDHDHATGKIRGILCGSCNRGIGLLKDDTVRLVRALDYLNLWKP